MSIVIAGIENNCKLCICADKRADLNGVITDNYQKLFKLSPNLFFGMTGIAEDGFAVMRQMLDKPFANPDELIEFVDTALTPRSNQLTITLAGKWKSGKYFMWTKNNKGDVEEKTPITNGLVYSIASAGDERILPFFESAYSSRSNLRRAMVETVAFTASIDNSVSKTCDVYEI